jgi:hypothetical protein
MGPTVLAKPIPGSVQPVIDMYARRLGLDPQAVKAVGMVESSLRRNAIGDNGTSGGPFQLHVGGALPRGKSLAWAGTNSGIQYAMQNMAKYARGKTGAEAVSAIVKGFERPANISGEINRALSYYGKKLPALSGSVGPGPSGGGLPTGNALGLDDHAALLNYLMQKQQSFVNDTPAPSLAGALFAAQPALSTTSAGNSTTFNPQITMPTKGGGPRKLAVVPGTNIKVDAAVLPSVAQIAQKFGVNVNSGYRDPEHNAAVGGAENSDHLRGDAVDFTGGQAQMKRLYQWAQGKFPYVEPWGQAKGNHVHISFKR